MRQKRSEQIRITNEARVLRELRQHHGLSMRSAGARIGLSDSYISHVETGRLGPPIGEKLERLLKVYGNIKAKSFYERVRNYKKQLTPKEELVELVTHLRDEEVATVLAVVKGLTGSTSIAVPSGL